MKISEVCIRRPVFAWVMTLILIIIGVVGGMRLTLQQYPAIEQTYITIETSLPGAGPDIVESQLTKPIEEAVAGLEGVEDITSVSSTEDSKVTIKFVVGTKMETALNDVRSRLDKIKDKLPQEASDPMLTKSRADEKAVLTLALTSKTLPESELADYAIRELQKELESVAGVARVDVLGAGQYTMRIYLNPVKLAAYGLTITEVMRAIRRQNIEKPAGKLISKDREYLLTTIATMEEPQEFENIVIANKDGHLVRIKDVGRAEVTADDKRTKTRFNAQTAVTIGVIKQSNANLIAVAEAIKASMPELSKKLPPEIELHLAVDRSIFVEQSLKQVYKTILEATFLVILVVLVFLRSFRAAVIPLVTIPVSLVGALFLMYVLGFSINVLTLMAMVLAIGLVVDDAIIVLENVYRYLEQGMTPLKASLKGIREISFTVVATTLTLAAVYTPISLSTGLIGKLFTEFSITLAGAVLISGFVALTLSPMMCARMLKAHSKEAKVGNDDANGFVKAYRTIMSDNWLNWIDEKYEEYLKKSMQNRIKVVLSGLGFALFGLMIFWTLPREFTPSEDQGYINIEGQAPQSSTLEYTNRYVSEIDKILDKIPEIERRVLQINNPTFDGRVQLKADRKRSTDEIINEIKPKIKAITGIETRVESSSSGIGGADSNIVEFVVIGDKSIQELKKFAKLITNGLYRSGAVVSVRSEARADSEDYVITLRRDRITALDIEPASIGEIIDAMIRGQKASTYKHKEKMHDVKVEVEGMFRQSPKDITNMFVKAGDKEGTLVPLSELINIDSRSSPIEVRHYDRKRSVSMTAILKPSVSLGEGVDVVETIAKDALPSDIMVEFTGGTKRFLTESQSVYLIFGLALIFIYLVMAAQFESWVDPFVIMLSVPLSLAGAVLTLSLISGGSLNVYSQIGLVTLIGLITKHGIMMVDFANKLRDQGKEIFESILEASKLRLRPILMTTFAMVLGAVPLALASGAGAESRRQIGWVIVGGMTIGTLFTLFVLPSLYTYFTMKNRKKQLTTEDIETA